MNETQADYEQREALLLLKQLTEIDDLPLAERKDNEACLLDAMAHQPDLVAQRVGWLLDGNYGYGAMRRAEKIANSPRMNQPAALVQLGGGFGVALCWAAHAGGVAMPYASDRVEEAVNFAINYCPNCGCPMQGARIGLNASQGK